MGMIQGLHYSLSLRYVDPNERSQSSWAVDVINGPINQFSLCVFAILSVASTTLVTKVSFWNLDNFKANSTQITAINITAMFFQF